MLRLIALSALVALAPFAGQAAFAQGASGSFSPATQSDANSLLHLSPEEREQGRQVRESAARSNDAGGRSRKRHRSVGGMPGLGQ